MHALRWVGLTQDIVNISFLVIDSTVGLSYVMGLPNGMTLCFFFFFFFLNHCLFSCVANHKVENTCCVNICLCGLLDLGVTGLQLCDRSLKALLLRGVLQGPWDHKGYVALIRCRVDYGVYLKRGRDEVKEGKK
jgi:hypothetical protein